MARHNRNTKSKAMVSTKNKNLTPRQGEVTPRGGGGGGNGQIVMTPRKAMITPQSMGNRSGKSPAGSGMHAVAALESRGAQYDSNKAAKKSSALDYQRALDEQIFEDRKRKEEEKEKEARDELAFMRALRGDKKDVKVDFASSASPRSQHGQYRRNSGDREFEPSMDSMDMKRSSEGGLQNMVTIERPNDEVAYIERLPFAMGSGPDPSIQRMSLRYLLHPTVTLFLSCLLF